jgi:uroporphyrinogen-III synthase
MSRAGVRVLVTRPADQAGALAAALRGAGLEPVVAPTVEVVAVADLSSLDAALRQLGAYRWVILASANAARVVAERASALLGSGWETAGAEIVTGPAGGRVLEAGGLSASRVISPFSAAAVLAALRGEATEGARVLLPRAEGGREELAVGLRAHGALVDEVSAYRTVPVRESAELVAALWCGVGAVTFLSPSAVRGFVTAVRSGGLSVGRTLEGVVVACLGETTAGEARAQGLRVGVVPEETSADALVAALGAALAVKTGGEREVVCLA